MADSMQDEAREEVRQRIREMLTRPGARPSLLADELVDLMDQYLREVNEVRNSQMLERDRNGGVEWGARIGDRTYLNAGGEDYVRDVFGRSTQWQIMRREVGPWVEVARGEGGTA